MDKGQYPTTAFRPVWRPNEDAKLYWNGFPQVPRYMHGWLVTVRRCTRNSPYRVPLYEVSVHNWRGNTVSTKHAGKELRTVRGDQLIEP